MELSFKKKVENLQREVLLKSVDLDDDIDDFQIDIGDYSNSDRILTISPRCVRCDLCVEECPVDAIVSSNSIRRSRVKDNCVKCEICAQTCPVSCIYLLETNSIIGHEKGEIDFNFNEIKVPHRVLRMESVDVDKKKCVACGTCLKFCPTKAISLINDDEIDFHEDLKRSTLKSKEYSFIDEKLCIGCGACSNLCPQNAITIERFLGSIIETKQLLIDQNSCVECLLCEESCPVGAITLKDDLVVLDDNKCIRCNVCSTKCPVSALKLELCE
jgi:ferredoxin